MKTVLAKTIGGAALAATLAGTAAPATARDNGGISAGEVIAGALVIGGIAAIAAAASDRNDDRYDYGRAGYGGGYRADWRDDDWRRGGPRRVADSPREAVQRCVWAAERQASYFGRADVTDIRGIERIRGGYEVRGRLAVDNGWRGYRGGGGWNRDRDRGQFSCTVRFGEVQDVRLRGLGNYR